MVVRMRMVIAKTGADATCVRVDLSSFLFTIRMCKRRHW